MNKKIFALLFVLIFALSVSAVSAEDSGNFTALNTTITSATDTVDLSTDYVRGDADSANAIDINKDITINGNGKTIDGNNKGPIFTIGSGITVTVNDVTFIQGKGDYGGAINNLGTLILNNCKFLNNTATYQGGAVYSTGDLTIDKCVFDNNNITTRNVNQGYGGAAIANAGGDLKVTNTNITNHIPDYVTRNSSAQYIGDLIRGAVSSEGSASFENCNFINNRGCYGGAMTILDNNGNTSILEINNCIFKNNVAYNGGAIDILNGIANIKNSEFRNNSVIGKGDTNANSVGGAICAHNNIDVDITNCSFVDNSAAYSGGAIFIRDGDDTIRDCVFENNSAKLYGGAIYTEADLDVVGSNFTDNSAGTYGGAIYTYSDPGDQLNITDSKFTGNSAQYGGVLFNVEYTNITNSEFTDNVATGSGGAIYGYAALDIAGSKFINNSAVQGGAIINIKTTTVADSEFIDNVATTSSGGAIYTAAPLDVDASKFENNSASAYGGAIYTAAPLDVDASKFENNSASAYGGAIYTGKHADVSNSEFVDNTAPIGSAIFSYPDAAVLELDNVTSNKENSFYDNGTYIDDNVTYITETTLNNILTSVLDNVTVAGNVTPKANGNVTVTIGDVVKTAPVVNGTFEVDMGKFAVGNYTITVEFAKNDQYLASEGTASLTVANPYTLEASDVVKYFNNGTQYTVKVTDYKGNPVSNKTVALTLTNPAWKGPVTYYKVTDDDGVATLPIGLYAGTYGITAVLDDESVETTITVLPMTYSLESEDIYMTFKDGTSYTVTVIDADNNPVAGKTVAVTLTSPTWKKPATYNIVTDENGVAKLPLGLSVGKYGVTAAYGGESVSTTINVLKSAYKIETSDVVKYFKNGTQYTVTVKDLKNNPVEGKTVSVTLSSSTWKKPVTYNITTDENGVAVLPIGLSPGSYTASANVDGNIVKTSITVLPVLTTQSISKPVNQPASLYAKLVDGQGNPAAGKTVTFTVNTVTYYKTTDANGIATLPIGLCKGKWTILVADPETGAKATAIVTVTKAIS